MRKCRCHSLDTRSPCVLHLDALSVTTVTQQGIFVAGVRPIIRTRVSFSKICHVWTTSGVGLCIIGRPIHYFGSMQSLAVLQIWGAYR